MRIHSTRSMRLGILAPTDIIIIVLNFHHFHRVTIHGFRKPGQSRLE